MEIISGNIFIRPNYHLEKGHVIDGHTHTFDHTTFVIAGSIRVHRKNLNGTEDVVERKAGDHLLIKKGVEHEITALEDNTSYACIFSHRNSQGDVVQENDGWHVY